MSHKIRLICFLFCAVFCIVPAQKRVFYSDFSKKDQLILQGDAVIRDQKLLLNGKNSFAGIKNSSSLHIGDRGLTLAATVKFRDSASVNNRADSYDMIFSKKNEFIFGRNMKKMYVNLHDGKKWCAPALGGKAPVPGEWNHVAAVIRKFKDEAQGKHGYEIDIYINGSMIFKKSFFNIEPQKTENEIEIGSGFGGGPWLFNGEIANAEIYDYPMSEADILRLIKKDKHLSPVLKGTANVPAEFENICEAIRESRNDGAKWAVKALHSMSIRGGDNRKLISAAKKIKQFRNETFEGFVQKFNQNQKDFFIYLNSDLAAMIMLGNGKSLHPLAGVMDRKSGREIFGKNAISWSLQWRTGNVHEFFVQTPKSKDISWTSSFSDKNTLNILWKSTGKFTWKGINQIHFSGPRIESIFHVTNTAPGKQLHSVAYPEYSFAKLSGRKDKMVYPWMTGVEVEQPTTRRFMFGLKGTYPSGSATFQFGAYYDEHSGIYFGMEDGKGFTKDYSAVGKIETLDVSWNHPVKISVNTKGGNSFLLPGKAVIELYRGDWFEAGQIYRRFLEKEADWWIKDLPRKSTPEWYRNCALWIILTAPNEQLARDGEEISAYLREYFELPFGIHWYLWNDKNKGNYPHFYPRDFVLPNNQKLRKNGIYTMPYFNSRLWSLTDGPNGTDLEYSTRGAKYAAKGIDGKQKLEHYSKTAVYAVMCPAVEEWQKTLTDEVKKLAGYGFEAIYHDQIGTGAPVLCFDPTHKHALNDPAVWVSQGYLPMFQRFFKALEKDHPGICHSTEENAEPYLNLFDGYMIWRCTDAAQIPVFQSIYSGRIQFVGRLFNHVRPGDYQSFFSKVGQQLVNAEQLGWFPIFEMFDNDSRRLFVKKAMHVRVALLRWFNEGRRIKSLDFCGTMPEEKSLWGGMRPQIVSMPQIANSAWIDNNGNRMWLFVNTQNKKVRAVPAVPVKQKIWRCSETFTKPQLIQNPCTVDLLPYSFEVWVENDDKLAEQIQKTLSRIAKFDTGKPVRHFITGKQGAYQGIAGKLYSVNEASRAVGCIQKTNGFSWIQDNANIIFGEVDFGKSQINHLILNLSIYSVHNDNCIEIYAKKGTEEEQIARVHLNKTGKQQEFKDVKISLNKPLTGKTRLTFIFRGPGFCNFNGWKYE